MFHYFNTLTNTNGDSLVGYWVRATNASGVAQPIYADENETPIETVSGIANTALTDSDGNYGFFIEDGTWDLVFLDSRGVQLKIVRYVPMMTGPKGDTGNPGPADNTYTSLATFKAQDITNKAARLVGAPGITDGSFYWSLGNFTGQADDINIIKADSTSLSVGAWVRQAANSVAFQPDWSSNIRDVKRKAAEIEVSATDAGAKGDGAKLTDGAMTSGSATLTSASGPFTASDVGKLISVYGAGVSGAILAGTIISRSSNTSVTLSVSASTTVSGKTVVYGTDDTDAIQEALNCGADRIKFPGGRAGRIYLFTNLTLPFRVRLRGAGPRGAVLYQHAGSTGDAITFARTLPNYGVPADISEGAYALRNLGIDVASEVGISIQDGATASMLDFDDVRFVQRNHSTISGPKPYPVIAGTTAIRVDGGFIDGEPGPDAAAVYVAGLRNCEFRGFETGIKASNVVNEWSLRDCWFIDCKVGLDLHDCSTWFIQSTVESGVADSRGLILRGTTSNVVWVGGRIELTWETSYGIEFAPGYSGTQISFRNVNYVIEDDGSGLPGRKWTGTAPAACIFEGQYLDVDDGELRYFVYAPARDAVRYPSVVRHGGVGVGNGKIILGRDAGGNDVILEHDGSYLLLDGGPNGVKIAQTQFGSGYQKPFFIGSYALWIDSSGNLRMLAGTPTADSDGQAFEFAP